MSLSEQSFVETQGISAFNLASFQHRGITKLLFPAPQDRSSLMVAECVSHEWTLTPLPLSSPTTTVQQQTTTVQQQTTTVQQQTTPEQPPPLEIVSLASFNRKTIPPPSTTPPASASTPSLPPSSSSTIDQTAGGALQFAVLFNPTSSSSTLVSQPPIMSPRSTSTAPSSASSSSQRAMMVIYGKHCGPDASLEEISSTRVITVPLFFTPVRVVRVEIRLFKGWLVSSSTGSLHCFQETSSGYEERSLQHALPELVQIEASSGGSPVLCVAVLCVDSRRFMACGCSNGFVSLSVCDEFTEAVIRDEAFLDGPISSLCFYTPGKQSLPSSSRGVLHPVAVSVMSRAEDYALKTPPKQITKLFVTPEGAASSDHLVVFRGLNKRINLAAAGALGFIVNFVGVNDGSLKNCSVLPDSEGFDAVTSLAACDLDFDGNTELVATTFGNTLLVFGVQQSTDLIASQQQTPSAATEKYVLRWSRRFGSPLFKAICCKSHEDELEQVFVGSSCGIHQIQMSRQLLISKILAEISAFKEILTLENQRTQLEQSPPTPSSTQLIVT